MRRTDVGVCVNKNIKKIVGKRWVLVYTYAGLIFLQIGQKNKNRNYNSLKVK